MAAEEHQANVNGEAQMRTHAADGRMRPPG